MVLHYSFNHRPTCTLLESQQIDSRSVVCLILPTWPERLDGRPASKLPCLLNGIPTTGAVGRALTRGPWFVNIWLMVSANSGDACLWNENVNYHHLSDCCKSPANFIAEFWHVKHLQFWSCHCDQNLLAKMTIIYSGQWVHSTIFVNCSNHGIKSPRVSLA